MKIKPVASITGKTCDRKWIHQATVSITFGCECHGSVPDVTAHNDVADNGRSSSSDEVNGKAGLFKLLFPEKTTEDFPVAPQTFQFSIGSGDFIVSSWNGIQVDSDLFVEVPAVPFPAGSKEGLVELLDYAEETLGMKRILLCIPKEMDNKEQVLRSFMFLGFKVTPPLHHGSTFKNPNFIFMSYTFE